VTLTKADVQCEKLLTVAGRTELIYLFDINSKGPVAVSLHAAQCRIRYNVATIQTFEHQQRLRVDNSCGG